MSEQGPLDVVVAAFNNENGASDALKELRGVSDTVLQIKEAAVLVRNSNGRLDIRESHHLKRGAVMGGIAGAVVGLIAGPVGWMTVGGAAVGTLASRLRDSGFPDEKLKQVGEALTPGTSALIAIVEHRWVLEVQNRLQAAAAQYVTEELKQEVAAQLDEQAKTRA